MLKLHDWFILLLLQLQGWFMPLLLQLREWFIPLLLQLQEWFMPLSLQLREWFMSSFAESTWLVHTYFWWNKLFCILLSASTFVQVIYCPSKYYSCYLLLNLSTDFLLLEVIEFVLAYLSWSYRVSVHACTHAWVHTCVCSYWINYMVDHCRLCLKWQFWFLPTFAEISYIV